MPRARAPLQLPQGLGDGRGDLHAGGGPRGRPEDVTGEGGRGRVVAVPDARLLEPGAGRRLGCHRALPECPSRGARGHRRLGRVGRGVPEGRPARGVGQGVRARAGGVPRRLVRALPSRGGVQGDAALRGRAGAAPGAFFRRARRREVRAHRAVRDTHRPGPPRGGRGLCGSFAGYHPRGCGGFEARLQG